MLVPLVAGAVAAIVTPAAAGDPAAGDSAAGPAVTRGADLAASAIRLPEGYRGMAVASEPNLGNPVAFCFDPQGRIFVAESYRVRKGVEDNRWHMDWLDDDLAARSVADRRAFMVRRAGDDVGQYTSASELVRLVEDRDGDGLYEQSSVFSAGYNDVEDGAAAGVLWVDDRLLFACIPALWELRDADGDGQAEDKRALYAGFGVHVALFGHDLHGLCEGPDGRIYFSIDDRGLNVPTSAGPLVNLHSGAVLRCRRDGSELELFATGLRNPQELAFNDRGDLFTVDNNSDSGDRARLVHVVEGMQAGWRMSYQYLPDRGPFNREKIWHTANADQPASIVPPLAHVADGPSGLAAYPGTGLPAENDGAFFLCDFRGMPGGSGVRRFWVEPNGATYRLQQDELFAAGVLATDCEFGPDGALYIADWIDGWTGQGAGRIHRVATSDAAAGRAGLATQDLLERLPGQSPATMTALLGHADVRVRRLAQRRLAAAGAEVAPAVLRMARDREAPLLARLHAVWTLGELGAVEPGLFAELAALSGDPEAEVRAQIAKTLGEAAPLPADQRRPLGAALVPLVADPAPRVQAFAAIALGKLRHAAGGDALLPLARQTAEQDATLRHAASMGLAGSQTSAELVARATGGEASEGERLAIAVALGRQRSPLVATLLRDPAPRVQLEAARIIWDAPLDEAYGPLADLLPDAPSGNEPLVRRALAAATALGGPARLEAVIACGLRDDLSQPMREHAWTLVRHWSSPSPRDPVHGEWRPAAPRAVDEVLAGLRAAWPRLAAASSQDPLPLIVAAELGLGEAYEPLGAIVSSDEASPDVRARALAALGEADAAIVRPAAERALQSDSVAIRLAARRLLVRRFPEQAVDALRAAAEVGEVSERQDALELLGTIDAPAARRAVAAWMNRLEAGDCPAEIQLEVLEAAARSGDPELAARQQAYHDRLAGEGPLAAYGSSLHGGDAARGAALFAENAALSCRRCHAVEAGVALVGPNLADVGKRLGRPELLESIVSPNAKIADGFQTTALLLDTGQMVAGILRREDDREAVLVDAEGKELAVDVSTIEERSQGLSAMPEELMKLMTPRDLRDLVEYLSTLHGAAEASH